MPIKNAAVALEAARQQEEEERGEAKRIREEKYAHEQTLAETTSDAKIRLAQLKAKVEGRHQTIQTVAKSICKLPVLPIAAICILVLALCRIDIPDALERLTEL